MLQEEYQYCFKCENLAEVALTFKNNGLVTRLLKNQVFTLSFHLVMSEFLLEKEQEK